MRYRILVVVLVMLGLQTAFVAQSNIPIEGVVLEATTERPISGVLVTAVSGSTTLTGTTNSEGRFSIELPYSGRYRITPSREGMVDARPRHLYTWHEPGVWVQVSAVERNPTVPLYMQAAAVISGQVLDSDGKAFPEVRGSVSPMRYTYDENGTKTLLTTPGLRYGISPVGRMDEKGNYRLFGLQPGDYFIFASGGGAHVYYPGTSDKATALPVHVEAGQEVHLPLITLPAQKPVVVHFHLTDLNGKPLPQMSGLQFFTLLGLNGESLISTSGFGSTGNTTSVVGTLERNMGLAPGQYDFLVSLMDTSDVYYAVVQFNLGNNEIDQELHLARGPRVTGNINIESDQGQLKVASGVYCRLVSSSRNIQTVNASTATKGCLGSSYSPELYRLQLGGMSEDAFVASAKSGGKDILADGLRLDSDTDLQIVIKASGTSLEGIVKNSAGENIAGAVVALMPDAPLHNAGVLYRSDVSDVSGKYQLRGIAPGAYHLFAWNELEANAYRNAEFMKDYDGKGIPVQIQGAHPAIVVTAFD